MNFSDGEAAWAGLVALFGGFLVVAAIIAVAVCVLLIVATVKIFKKAGKAGWEAIVPYYSTWVLCEISGVIWYFFLGMMATAIFSILGLKILLPLAGLINLAASFCVYYNLSRKFGKDPIGFGIGLTLLPVVFLPILGFGSAEYKDVKVSQYGPIEEDKINGTAPKKEQKTEAKEEPKKGKFCKNCGAEVKDGKFCPNCGTEIH